MATKDTYTNMSDSTSNEDSPVSGILSDLMYNSGPLKPKITSLSGNPTANELSTSVEVTFEPSVETIQKAQEAFERAFDSDCYFLVPESLIASIQRDQPMPTTEGLHIREYLDEQRNPNFDEQFNYTFAWFLGNGFESEEAQKLARKLFKHNNVLIENDLSMPEAELEKKRLLFHEGIHRFFEEMETSQDPQLQMVSRQMKQAYSSIVSADKLDAERLLNDQKYTPRQKVEEYWTYFLTAKLYPPPESHPVQAFINVGNDQNIQKILEKLPFLQDVTTQAQIIDRTINSATEIKSKP